MFIGHVTERPYQDPASGYFGATGLPIKDLTLSNESYDSKLGAELYNRYIDEYLYAEEVGFDAININEHHSTPFCMGSVMNLEAAIYARQSKKAKIVLLGNILPIWEDPLWLVEQLSIIDMISRGRLVSGFVRGTGRESIAHNAPPAHNWERFQEAHDFIIKAWTTPGPFRWEGKHYQYRYVNPWAMPYQKPHPPVWIPGIASPRTVTWAAEHRYPYVMLATALEPTKQCFQLYKDTAAELGYEAGTQNTAYVFKVHVDETEELADQVGRKYVQGPSNPFLAGNEGTNNNAIMSLPGHTQRRGLLPTRSALVAGRAGEGVAYEDQTTSYSIISGTPKTVIPKIRHVLEYLRPGSIFLWDGDGSMTHEDTMRSLRLKGEEVIPAIHEMAKELELYSPFEVDPATNKPVEAEAPQEAELPAGD